MNKSRDSYSVEYYVVINNHNLVIFMDIEVGLRFRKLKIIEQYDPTFVNMNMCIFAWCGGHPPRWRPAMSAS